MIRYYCSGFDISNTFGNGLGEMFKKELKNNKSIVFIPGGAEKIEKARTRYVPLFTNVLEKEGIKFDETFLITPDMNKSEAKEIIKNASFVMILGGNPIKQKEMCENLEIMKSLKEYDGLMLGFSAGAMLMSKKIIITPCSEEYPDFQIEDGLNLDEISIYPHNNTESNDYPETLVIGDETYEKKDLITVAKQYGDFYLLQDHLREDNSTDVSIIKVIDNKVEYYTENNGKIWIANNNDVVLEYSKEMLKKHI